METMPKIGVATAIGGICTSFVLTAGMFYLLLFSPEYRDQLNETSKLLYGYTYDELLEESYGITLDDLARKVTGNPVSSLQQ